MKKGAQQGLILAQNTIIPSLLPLLIIFLTIIKSGGAGVMAKPFAKPFVYLFNLPSAALPALLFGMLGGYPTGALLTAELYENGDLDGKQARRLMRFNVCGGCGFIISATGGFLNSRKIGVILFASNVIANLIIGFIQSFSGERIKEQNFFFGRYESVAEGFNDAVKSSVLSVLSIGATVSLFGALCEIANPPAALIPLFEITNGLFTENSFSLPQISGYLAFSGLCIHLQLLPVLSKINMSYGDFFVSRAVSGILSLCITKIILAVFPQKMPVFSNYAENTAAISGINIVLTVLMIFGCFVFISDISSRKKRC